MIWDETCIQTDTKDIEISEERLALLISHCSFTICLKIYTQGSNGTYHKQLLNTLNYVNQRNKSCKYLFCEASEQFHQDTALKTHNHHANNSQPKAYIHSYCEEIQVMCQTELKQQTASQYS